MTATPGSDPPGVEGSGDGEVGESVGEGSGGGDVPGDDGDGPGDDGVGEAVGDGDVDVGDGEGSGSRQTDTSDHTAVSDMTSATPNAEPHETLRDAAPS